MTRAFISMIKFDFISALNYNRLSVPLFIGVFIYCVLLIVDLVSSKDTTEKYLRLISNKYMFLVYFVAVALNYII